MIDVAQDLVIRNLKFSFYLPIKYCSKTQSPVLMKPVDNQGSKAAEQELAGRDPSIQGGRQSFWCS